jgi:hypothetical protein
MKYWERVADNLKKSGWSLGWVSALGLEGRTIWIADAHRDNGKRFVESLVISTRASRSAMPVF